MNTVDTRKIRLINELTKLKNEVLLGKIEHILKINKSNKPSSSIFDFVGFLSDSEALKMKKAIAATCEKIDEDVWK